MYVNGLSTSLPPSVQLQFLQSVPGLEQAQMTRPGYAIEYDYFPPTQLLPTLEVRTAPGLFLAGQVNGTTGYEEAAGQGALAGLNAAARARELEPVVLPRNVALMGVMVDDLVSRGVDEPYRLFTSRSEFRLLLRQDNALRRLLPLAERLGILSKEELVRAERRLRAEEKVMELAESTWIEPAPANEILELAGSSPVAGPRHQVAELARRPGTPLLDLLAAGGVSVNAETAEWSQIELKYSGYLARERAAASRLSQMDMFVLPEDLDYQRLATLSTEARQKLGALRPSSLGQAGRVPGISPSDLQSLVMEVVKRRQAS